MKANVWIVIPVFNQPERFFLTVNKAKEYGHVVVIDDCSKTQVKVNDWPEVRVVRHCLNRGQGAALQTGTDFALKNGADYIVHLDADGQHDPDDIPRLLKPLFEAKADVVFGSRFLDNTKVEVPWTKKWFILKPAIYLHNLWFKAKLTDVHNGYRALNHLSATKIKITQDRQAHPTQILQQVISYGLNYQEVAIIVNYYEYGQNLGDGFKILKDILIRWLSK